MREKVCLVLNEREPAKAKAAALLETHLNHLGISVARLAVNAGIAKAILARPPQIVVIDYLLGDYSTGLDVMASVRAGAGEQTPSFVFLLTNQVFM